MTATAELGVVPLRVLLDQAIWLTRRHLGTIYPSVAAVSVGYGMLALLFQYWIFNGARVGSPGTSCLVMLVAMVVGAVGWLANVAMMGAAVDVVAGRPVEMRRAWRWVVRGRVLGTLLLTAICIGGAYIACFFPALYVIPLLSLVVPVMVEEGRFGGAAIARSAKLTRFNPRRNFVDNPISRAFVALVSYLLVSTAFSLPTTVPFQAVKMVLMMRRLGEEGAAPPDLAAAYNLWLDLPVIALTELASTLAGLYLSFALALLFFDCRRRRDGTDLEAAVDALDAAAPTAGGETAP